MGNVIYRNAEERDVALVLEMIKIQADYEKMSDQVKNTEEMLYKTMFVDKLVKVLIGEEDGTPFGFALYFYNYSTFIGRLGIYIEDVHVLEKYRGKGYGKGFFKEIAKIATAENCGRIEWTCLDWNKPSIDFYLKMGAVAMDEWTNYRLTEDVFQKMAVQ